MNPATGLPTTRPADPPPPGPTAPEGRIEAVDILRGFAVFGILVANMASFAGRSTSPADWAEPLDQAIVVLHRLLVEAKFYSLFSFLFGWGLAVQLRRAAARQDPFTVRFLRRMAVLLAFGLLHAVFLWSGDILTLYALFGLVLLLFRRRSPTFLLAAAGLVLLLSFTLTLPGEAVAGLREAYTELTEPLRAGTLSTGLYATGTYAEITRLRLQDFLGAFSWVLLYAGNVFSMFLLGLYAGRRGVFADLAGQRPLLRRVLLAGLLIGLPLNGVFAWTILHPDWVPGDSFRLFSSGARTLGAPALMLAYAAGLSLLSLRPAWRARLAPLAPVGRMALSNYILHSVLGTLVFYSYGLGLYGETDPSFGLLLTVLIFLLQIRLSAWWLERYPYGPLEWLWRALTYGRRPALGHGEPPRPLPLMEPARRWLRRRHPAVPLAAAWALLLIWGAALGLWYARLEADAGLQPEQVRVEITATAPPAASLAAGPTPGSQAPPTPVVTPDVQPLAYRPGPLAAAGDLEALAEAFDLDSALSEIERLVGPPHLGRYGGSPEGRAAAAYIAERFAAYRLQPAGLDGSFFQPFPVPYTPLDGNPQLAIQGPVGGRQADFEPFLEYAPIVRMYAGPGQGVGPVVWAGDCEPGDFEGLPSVGAVVLCAAGSAGSQPHVAGRVALEHGAAGLLLLTDPDQRPPGFGDTYFEAWVPEPLPVFRIYPSLAGRLLQGSPLSVDDLWSGAPSVPLATRVEMAVQIQDTCPEAGCQAQNVLGVLPGRDPAFADQVVILGGHYDHLGQGPQGQVWGGANDNASGIAVLLEIARVWAEEGYVPRRTVVFAAWDAEELGLLGSRHYAAHPSYPLESTVAMIQLDMVGAGAETLKIDGTEALLARLMGAAESLEIPAEHTRLGRSDHVPFLEAGVPASLLIWWDDQAPIPHYHNLSDTPDVIEPHKLQAVGRLAGTVVLDLADREPALLSLMESRQDALNRGDLEAFLNTALPELQAAERRWFSDLQSLNPRQVTLTPRDLQIEGQLARAVVQFKVETGPPEGSETPGVVTASLPARFVRRAGAWRWGGPDLVAVPPPEGTAALTLAHSPETEDHWPSIARSAAAGYAALADLLGGAEAVSATLELHPDAGSLQAATGLSLPDERRSWAGEGVLKLVYTPAITTSQVLQDGLAHLWLAEAGLSREAAPWLWQGLPRVLQARSAPIEVQRRLLPDLEPALSGDSSPQAAALSWAATDFLRQRLGWQGLGSFISEWGQACRRGACQDDRGLGLALDSALGLDPQAFQKAWQEHWAQRLNAVQAGLEVLTSARQSAVARGDLAAFLSTVDANVPHLLAEEQAWFEALEGAPLQRFSLQAHPLVLQEDGAVLAEVITTWRLPGEDQDRLLTREVQLAPHVGGYRWAGPRFDSLGNSQITVRFPPGREAAAQGLQADLESLLSQVAGALGLGPPGALTLTLYDDPQAFQAGIALAFDPVDWATGWTGPGQSLKLRLGPGDDPAAYRPALVQLLIRSLLLENGVRSEWLLKGVSLYAARPFDGGASARAAAAGLPALQAALAEGALPDLQSLPPDHTQERAAYQQASAQAWDSLRYLIETYGQPALQDLIARQGQGLEGALRSSLGSSLQGFQARWQDSLAAGHSMPDWEAIAGQFDQDRAFEHAGWLSSPDLDGRPAGSPGEAQAAGYVAAQFAAAGLLPAGDISGTTFLQSVPISVTAPRGPLRLELRVLESEVLLAFEHRVDFIARLPGTSSGGPVTGELVWAQDLDDPQADLAGKIVLHRPAGPISDARNRAAFAGARGLILVGTLRHPEETFAKAPWMALYDREATIPVLELTQGGYVRFLEGTGLDSLRLQQMPAGTALGVTASLDFRLGAPRPAESVNVLGLLPGADPILGQEVIVLGAHLDHVGDDRTALVCLTEGKGQNPCRRVPARPYSGANDDASGLAVLLEIARLWQAQGYRPQRSVLFAAWGAQEPGQRGSGYFVAHSTLPAGSILAVLQLDGVGGGEGFNLGAQGDPGRDGWLLFSLENAAARFGDKVIVTPKTVASDHLAFEETGAPSLLVHWRLASEANLPDGVANGLHPDRLGVSGRLVTLAAMLLAR